MGSVLIVGSPSTAQSGAYQAAIEAAVAPTMHMLDRIMTGYAELPASHFRSIHVVLSPPDYASLYGGAISATETDAIKALNAKFLASLASEGIITWLGLERGVAEGFATEMKLAGFSEVSEMEPVRDQLVMSAKKPKYEAGARLSLKKPSAASNGLANKTTTKTQLWTEADDDEEELLDDDQFLDEKDRARGEAVQRPGCDVKTTRRACANCTCGLREAILLEQSDDLPSSINPNSAAGQAAARGGSAALKGATSSCGNCYLGDAFRCSSCPYIGMPAFKPGEQVTLEAGGMGDDY